MGVLNWITQGCDALTATASPTIDALGVRMCIALATIMLVWFGVQESLASTHGGQGFHMGKFLSFFMLITFAYTLVRFYDSSIPGVGQSFRGFINGGAQYLVSVIGSDSITPAGVRPPPPFVLNGGPPFFFPPTEKKKKKKTKKN